MSTKPPIAYMDIRVFAHATEDPDKVQTAVRNLLPTELSETLIFEIQSCTGHHGNPIILFTSKLTDKKLLPKALEKIGKDLGALDKEELDRDIKLHLEKGNLYLRFDKQSAFLGATQAYSKRPYPLKNSFQKQNCTRNNGDF